MSYASGASNGYTNGPYAGNKSRPVEEDLEEDGSLSTSRAHRTGSYGGFMSDTLPASSEDGSAVHSRQRPYDQGSNGIYTRESPDRELRSHNAHERSRSQDREGPDMRGARTYGATSGGRQIEGQYVQGHYDLLAYQPKFSRFQT